MRVRFVRVSLVHRRGLLAQDVCVSDMRAATIALSRISDFLPDACAGALAGGGVGHAVCVMIAGLAKTLAAACKAGGVRHKIYTGAAEDRINKEDFDGDIDVAWAAVQVVIATSSVTVAVDPRQWHCDICMVRLASARACPCCVWSMGVYILVA